MSIFKKAVTEKITCEGLKAKLHKTKVKNNVFTDEKCKHKKQENKLIYFWSKNQG
jgi:hypothetical protein